VSELTQIMAGSKDATKTETPTPLAEKVAETKPVEDVTAKLVEKKEVKAAREPPPAAEATPSEPKPSKAETKPDPIAEALVKEPAKKPETKKAEAKAPTPPKKPAPPAPKFDPHKVAELLDKRDATRVAAAGPALGSTPSVGLPTAHAKTLSLSELDALRQRLHQFWNIPAGARNPQELVSVFRIKLRPDGRLAEPPMLVSGRDTPLAIVARENAARAINRGQPFDMLRPENYELWKDIEITFDPREM
jgi:colicin import membrane protein